jgi:hypothetical protein
MKKYLLGISFYTGLIAALCATRVMHSLARHGHIMWGMGMLYTAKLVFIGIGIYTYRYLTREVAAKYNNQNLLNFLIKLSPVRLMVLVVSSGFVFEEFRWTSFSMTRGLIFRWWM